MINVQLELKMLPVSCYFDISSMVEFDIFPNKEFKSGCYGNRKIYVFYFVIKFLFFGQNSIVSEEGTRDVWGATGRARNVSRATSR